MAAHKDEQTKGLALVLLSTLAYGAMPIFAKTAYAAGFVAAPLLAWRFALATALFALFASKKSRGLALRDHWRLWGLGCVFVVNAFAYFKALETIPASTAAVLVYTYPVMVTVLSGVLGFDRFTLRGLIAAVLSFSGCAFTAGATSGGAGLGVFLVLLSAFLYSIYMLLGSRFAAHLPAEATASHTVQAAALFCIPFCFLQGTAMVPPTPRAWAAVFAIAAISTVVALRALLSGMARIGPVRAAVLSSLEVVVTLTLAAVFLGEALGVRQLLGASLILGAVVLQNLGTLRRLARRAGGPGSSAGPSADPPTGDTPAGS
jgi:drug/metabolite transporter (DMT)-like permease